ncbi:MAG: hypothetical protein HGA97_00770 [Chlorobiaceae bacterium]|jgi:hypothetical protein|nr:hypothetical protein [Chlorobiaceae bacterium]
MPIEIRELNIRVSVGQNQPEEEQQQGNVGSSALPDKDELIAECVEQVMELIKLQRER